MAESNSSMRFGENQMQSISQKL